MRKNKFGEILEKYLDYYNISVNDFADRVGSTSKNIIDIIDGNITLSQNMIYNIAFITDISVEYIENVERNFEFENKINTFVKEKNITVRQFINMFNYKELSEKYGIIYNDVKDDYTVLEDIFKFLRISNPNLIYKTDNKIFYKSKNDKPELLALWLERCYRMILNQEIKEYKKENIEILVKFIRDLAKRNIFDEDKLKKKFNECGIFLAIEEDLKGSKIRGAFRVHNNKPAIYLTKKYKRIADVYFALLHELAHCKTDFNRAKSGSIVSLLDDDDKSDYELRADKQALNWMVPEKDYEEIVNSKVYKYEIESFLVYRLAQDNYISYNSKLYQEKNVRL